MTNILLMLLLSVTGAQCSSRLPSCPASCVVCSEEAFICHRLAHIIDAPDSTQALLLTEGTIASVQPPALSDLNNLSLIGLSHNLISMLEAHSFSNLSLLHTLLLDHNLLTSQVLQGGALTHLSQLKVLSLGHNHISRVESAWFEGLVALQNLKLEGNLLISLDSGSFPVKDFSQLESLDLSDNLIDHIDRSSFHGLVGLQTLDLSRNRLSSAPAEAFSYLSWLADLNLDLNRWNCSCQLLDLAGFLSSFIQQPDKVLHNGQRMVCVNVDNPAVSTMLELTEANCVPANRNISIQVEAAHSVTPRVYARDVAIAAVTCFCGGVGWTLLVVLIQHRVSHRKKQRESKVQQEKEEAGTSLANHRVNHLNGGEKGRGHHLQANSSQPWDRTGGRGDPRAESHGESSGFRGGQGEGQVRCPDCSAEVQRRNGPKTSRWDNGEEEETERRRGRGGMEEDRRRPGTLTQSQHGILVGNAGVNGSSNFAAHSRRDAVRAETPPPYRMGRETDSYRTDTEEKRRGREVLHCHSCHRTYPEPEHNARQDLRGPASTRDPNPFDPNPVQYRQSDRGRYGVHSQLDPDRNRGTRRETRNVTFDLGSFRMPEGGNLQEEERRTEERGGGEGEGGSRRHRAKGHSGRLLKVKMNLNPLRRSKVHPKKKSDSSDRSSPKKERHSKRSKEKRKGEREEKKKSAKTKGLTEEEEEEENGGEGGQKSKTSSKQNKNPSNTEPPVQENNSQHAPGGSAEQSDPAGAPGRGLILQGAGLQLQDPRMLLGSGPQLPFSLSAADRSRTANLSLLSSLGGGTTGFPRTTANIAPPHPASAPDLQSFTRAAGASGPPSLPLSSAAPPSTLQTPHTARPTADPAAGLLQYPPPSDPAQGPALQSREGPPAPQITGVLQPDSSASAAPLAPLAPELVPGENLPPSSAAGPAVGECADVASPPPLLQQEYVSEDPGSSPKRKLRLVLPEKTSDRPPTALERKIR